MSELPKEGFVRVKQILQVFPVSARHWWSGVEKGEYPKPIKLSPKITVWKVEDIRQLIEELKG